MGIVDGRRGLSESRTVGVVRGELVRLSCGSLLMFLRKTLLFLIPNYWKMTVSDFFELNVSNVGCVLLTGVLFRFLLVMCLC